MSQDTTGWTVQDDSNEYKGDFNIRNWLELFRQM